MCTWRLLLVRRQLTDGQTHTCLHTSNTSISVFGPFRTSQSTRWVVVRTSESKSAGELIERVQREFLRFSFVYWRNEPRPRWFSTVSRDNKNGIRRYSKIDFSRPTVISKLFSPVSFYSPKRSHSPRPPQWRRRRRFASYTSCLARTVRRTSRNAIPRGLSYHRFPPGP